MGSRFRSCASPSATIIIQRPDSDDTRTTDSSQSSSSMHSNACSEWAQRPTLRSRARAIWSRTSEPIPISLRASSSAYPRPFSRLVLKHLTLFCNSAQRNVYLTGFTLFLSLVLTRTFYISLDLIHTQEEYSKLKQAVRMVPKTCPVVVTDWRSCLLIVQRLRIRRRRRPEEARQGARVQGTRL